MKKSKPIAIALWSGPRNVSTALMYSFGNRGDCRIIDEPLFGHFLSSTGASRPSREEALGVMSTDALAVLEDMKDRQGRELVFSKNIANHIEGLDYKLLDNFRNFILIREPAAVINSYVKQVRQPDMLDLAYLHQLQIAEKIRAGGSKLIVVDSDELRNKPSQVLRKLCSSLDIGFTEKMLNWPAGPRAEDGVWARYWYHRVHESTGFTPLPKGKVKIHPEYEGLYRQCLELYNEIKSKAHE